MAWHGQSEYPHSSQFRALDRNNRATWRGKLDLAARRRQLTGKAYRVGLALIAHHGPDGRCDPSHARIAEAAGCAERTVRNALQQLAGVGLIAWTRRMVRTAAGARQTSSAYRLILAAIAEAAPRLARTPAGKNDRGTLTAVITRAAQGAAAMLAELRPAESLAQIAQRRAALLGQRR